MTASMLRRTRCRVRAAGPSPWVRRQPRWAIPQTRRSTQTPLVLRLTSLTARGWVAADPQPLQPDGAVRWQPARETRDLAPAQIRRSENLFRKRCAMGCIEQPGADRIGPENPRAVDRPEPRRVGACGMHRQSRIADSSQLEFG